MTKFLKLDLADEDNLETTTHEAENMETLIKTEYKNELGDDRLCACHGTTNEQALSYDHDSLQWEPGDGAVYTIAMFFPDTPEGRENLEINLER